MRWNPGRARTNMRRQAYPRDLNLATAQTLTAPFLMLLAPGRGITGQSVDSQSAAAAARPEQQLDICLERAGMAGPSPRSSAARP